MSILTTESQEEMAVVKEREKRRKGKNGGDSIRIWDKVCGSIL